MTRIRIRSIIWDKWNVIHIRKHSVTQKETEIAIANIGYHKQSYNERYLLVGRSGKRILSVVVKRQSSSTYYIVTVRDANKKERRRLYEKEQKTDHS